MTFPRSLALATLAVLALSLAGCAAAESPGWTYAPSPSTTPAPAPSEAPASASASAGPSASASAGPSASAGGSESPAGAVTLTAMNIQFDKTELTGPANTPFTLTFDNQDAGIPHNVEILGANDASLWKGEIFNGVEKRDYQVPAIPAGTYKFHCTVHPNMVGKITLQ